MTTRTTVCSFSALLVAVGLLVLPSAASAQSTKLEALVFEVSNSGNHVDPALSALAQSWKRSGFPYTNYKLVNRSNLTLATGQAGSVSLGRGQASLKVLKVEANGKVEVQLKAPGVESTYSISPGAEVTQQVGTPSAGKLFIVLRR